MAMMTPANSTNISTTPDRKRTLDLDWEDVRYFIALVRYGSLAAAARALRVNHATVARRVTNLETLLGHSLFDRRATGYVLTAHGKAALDGAAAMDEGALSVLRRRDSSTEINGLVRLTAPRVLADAFIIDRLGGLKDRYPALDIELIGEARVMSLARRETDIALRLGSPKDSELVGRRVGNVGFGFYASPQRRDELAAGQTPSMIGFDDDSSFIFEASWLSRQFHNHRFQFRTNSQTAQVAAARAGYGIALLPRYLACRDPNLVQVALGEPIPVRETWLLVRRDLTKVPRIRAVADYLADMFHKEQSFLLDGA